MNVDKQSKRYSINWPVELHERAKKAALIQGHDSLKSYLLELVDRDSKKTIEDYFTLTISNDDFDRFVEVLERDVD